MARDEPDRVERAFVLDFPCARTLHQYVLGVPEAADDRPVVPGGHGLVEQLTAEVCDVVALAEVQELVEAEDPEAGQAEAQFARDVGDRVWHGWRVEAAGTRRS